MNINIGLLIYSIVITYGFLRYSFKIGYYKQKLKNHNIKDSVKDMPIYKLFLR